MRFSNKMEYKIKRLDKFEAYKAHRNAGSEFKSEDGSIPDLRKNFIEYGYDPSSLVSFSPKSKMTDWSSLYEADKEADDLIAEKVLSILSDRVSHPNPKILIIWRVVIWGSYIWRAGGPANVLWL